MGVETAGMPKIGWTSTFVFVATVTWIPNFLLPPWRSIWYAYRGFLNFLGNDPRFRSAQPSSLASRMICEWLSALRGPASEIELCMIA
jgi:hypothetical protein